MSQTADLFDRSALALRRARAAAAPVDFLHREAATQVSERLEEVKRAFTKPAIVGPMPDPWQEMLSPILPSLKAVPDTDPLGLEPQSHDLIIHALGLHLVNDPVGQLVQMRHALRPDGLMIAVLFGGQSLSELRASLAEAEVELTGGLSPRVAPMGEIRDLGGLLQRAGFALPVADSIRLTVTYADISALFRDLRGMGETNVLSSRRKVPMRRDVLLRTAEIYNANFPAENGRIRATAEFVFLTGWAPSDSQPKPLRPGSAAQRLADALGTTEVAVPDPSEGRTGSD